MSAYKPLKKNKIMLFEYQKGRFLNTSKVITASVYNKDTGKTSDIDGSKVIEIRVAIDLDSVNKYKSTVYTGPFKSEQEAINLIKSIPVDNE